MAKLPRQAGEAGIGDRKTAEKQGIAWRGAGRPAGGRWTSAKLALESGIHPGELKNMVTSPGGTTISGLHALEEGGLRTTLMNAVEAATKRSIELGRDAVKNQNQNKAD